MTLRSVVRQIARRIPPDLKQLRGKLMLETLCKALGVEEVCCPACAGTGWLNRRALERCPLCCGFQEVPERLADWFTCQFRRATQSRQAGRLLGKCPDEPERLAAPHGERLGRLAETCWRVCLPAGTPEG